MLLFCVIELFGVLSEIVRLSFGFVGDRVSRALLYPDVKQEVFTSAASFCFSVELCREYRTVIGQC